MSDLIHITVVGRLTRDAELRTTNNGHEFCRFSVAAKPYGSDDALFFNATLWGQRGASLQPHLGKGQQVVVVGDYSERTYEKDGEQRTSRDLRANDLSLVGARVEREESDTGGDEDKDALEDLF